MANERLSDDAIQFRIRARRRLIGAIILSLAAVAILPWALDNHPPASASNLAVYLYPDKSTNEDATAITSISTTAVNTAVPPTESESPAKTLPEKSAVNQTKPDFYQGNSLINKNKSSPGPVSATYAIQLGFFTDSANAKKLADNASLLGFRVDLKKVRLASGNAIRVRIGPFDSKVKAEQAIHKLEKKGMKGVLVGNTGL